MNDKLATRAWFEWRRFLDEADEAALLSFIENHEELREVPALAYPYLHRLRDVALEGQGFRAIRAVIDDSEQLFFTQIADPNLDVQGVPEWITGAKLKAWILKEDASPSKGDVDWERYR